MSQIDITHIVLFYEKHRRRGTIAALLAERGDRAGSLTEAVHPCVRVEIDAYGRALDEAVQKGDVGLELHLLLRIMAATCQNNVTSIYGHALGLAATRNTTFYDALEPRDRYRLLFAIPVAGESFFCSADVIETNVCCDTVLAGYEAAATFAAANGFDRTRADGAIQSLRRRIAFAAQRRDAENQRAAAAREVERKRAEEWRRNLGEPPADVAPSDTADTKRSLKRTLHKSTDAATTETKRDAQADAREQRHKKRGLSK